MKRYKANSSKKEQAMNNDHAKQAETMFQLIGHTEEAYLEECEQQKSASERKQQKRGSEKKLEKSVSERKAKGRLANYFSSRSVLLRAFYTAAAAYLILLPAAHFFYERVMVYMVKPTKYVGASMPHPLSNEFYQEYYGPVLPLTTTLENPEDLQVERDIDLNFEAYDDPNGRGSVLVEDRYTITNISSQDISVNLYYPAEVKGMHGTPNRQGQHFVMYKDGEVLDTQWHKGAFSGRGDFYFTDHSNYNGSTRISTKNSYQDYQALLSDGSYLQATLDGENITEIEDKNVVEYTITNVRLFSEKENSDDMSTFCFVCDLDSEETSILLDNCISGIDEQGEGRMSYVSFEIMGIYAINGSAHLYVVGEDLQNIRCTDCKGNVLNEEDYKISRRETTLAEILFSDKSMDELTYSDKLYYQSIDYVLSDSTLYKRYYFLSDLEDYLKYMDMVFYLSGEITLKPSETTMITVQSVKYGSRNPVHLRTAGEKTRRWVTGYDFLLQTGSNLKFDEVTSQIRNYRNIDIMNQNFGFDLKKKITQVTLSQEQDCYYLVVAYKRHSSQGRKWYEWWSLEF